MFQPLAKNQDITFATVRDLAARFETSLTATAIRLVEYGSFPAVVVCSDPRGRVWFRRGPDVPETVWPVDKLSPRTAAYDLLQRGPSPGKPVDVQSSAWFELEGADRYTIREDSVTVASGFVLSLLWWVDERQLLELGE